MKQQLMNARRREEGQGMTEYIIIVALIAIAAIGVVTIFGDNIRDLFQTSNNALSGNVDASRQVTTQDRTSKSAGLDDFGMTNDGEL
ncbi:hypothetical protein JXR93_01165 [bacterium]|nr:hypothetical protein [bacterium]